MGVSGPTSCTRLTILSSYQHLVLSGRCAKSCRFRRPGHRRRKCHAQHIRSCPCSVGRHRPWAWPSGTEKGERRLIYILMKRRSDQTLAFQNFHHPTRSRYRSNSTLAPTDRPTDRTNDRTTDRPTETGSRHNQLRELAPRHTRTRLPRQWGAGHHLQAASAAGWREDPDAAARVLGDEEELGSKCHASPQGVAADPAHRRIGQAVAPRAAPRSEKTDRRWLHMSATHNCPAWTANPRGSCSSSGHGRADRTRTRSGRRPRSTRSGRPLSATLLGRHHTVGGGARRIARRACARPPMPPKVQICKLARPD